MNDPTTSATATEVERRQLAEAIRDRCLNELLQAWEDAGISGLCGDGRWEVAVGRLRSLSATDLLAGVSERSSSP